MYKYRRFNIGLAALFLSIAIEHTQILAVLLRWFCLHGWEYIQAISQIAVKTIDRLPLYVNALFGI